MSSSRKTISRRDVVRGTLAAAALGAAGGACFHDPPAPMPKPKPQPPARPAPKKILILGGTGFLGPKTVEAAVARGHTVTIFNRGKREKIQPLEIAVEHLYGNRDPELPAEDDKGPDGKLLHPDATPKGLEQLVGRSWDAVIDNSGYFPRMVSASATLLAPHVGQYIYISSISAYDENPAAGGDEDTRLATLADPTVETMGPNFENYGGLKVLCEKAAAAAMPGRTAVVRPGYIVGPGDPTDRFTYWPVRIARGGDVLAPGSPGDPLQWIDVRDLAAWLVTLVEHGTAGTFNAVGPSPSARWGDVLDACVAAAPPAAHPNLVWVPEDWLAANDAGGEDAFPIWVAPTGKNAGFHRWKNQRATDAGLTLRPMADTVRAILDWFPGEIERRVRVTAELTAKNPDLKAPDPHELRAAPGVDEAALLAKWKARS